MIWPAVTMPDAERVLIDHLNSLLEPPVSMTVPNPRPSSFMVVRRVGGPALNRVADNAMMTVEAWAPGPTAAKALLADARREIHQMRGQVIGGVTVYGITEVAGPAHLPDPDSDQPRYTMTVQVSMRGTAA